MNKKSLLLAASSLFTCAALCAQDLINNRYSDDVLFGKQALDRIIAGNGTNIKKVAPFTQPSTPVTQVELQKNQQEIQELDGLMGALDELEVVQQSQPVEQKSEEIITQKQQFDIRHPVTIVKYVAELEPEAQRLFNEALPHVKKRSYGFLFRDIGNATIKIWTEDLAKQILCHPSFRRLNPDAQNKLSNYLNRLFTNYFRSFFVQKALNEAQAKEVFAQLYKTIPERMVNKILKDFYPTLELSMIYNK